MGNVNDAALGETALVLAARQKAISESWQDRLGRAAHVRRPNLQRAFLEFIPTFLNEIGGILKTGRAPNVVTLRKLRRAYQSVDAKTPSDLRWTLKSFQILRELTIVELQVDHRVSPRARELIRSVFDEAVRRATLAFVRRQHGAARSDRSELEKARSRLAKAVDVSNVGFYEWDILNDSVEYSERAGKDRGTEAKSNMAQALARVHGEDRDRVSAHLEQCLRDGRRFHSEYRVVRADHSIVWIETKGEIATDASGRPTRFFGTSIDVSDRKRAELSTLEAKMRLDRVFQASPIAMGLYAGAEFVVEMVNPAYQAIFPNRDLIGKRFVDVFPELRDEPFLRIMQDVFSTGNGFFAPEVPATVTGTTGPERRFYDLSYVRVEDGHGKPYGVYKFGNDVTARVSDRRAVESIASTLAASQRNIESLFENARISVAFLKGAEHRFTFTNPAHRSILGFDAVGKTIREAQPEMEGTGFFERLDEVLREGRSFHFRETPIPIGDQIRYFDLTYTPSRDRDGNPDGVMSVALEITDLKRANLESLHARRAADQANQAKTAFLANMSHEIRTPLGAIIGFGDLAKDPDLTPEERDRYLSIVVRNGHGLTRIIDDILDLAKVEADRLVIENIEFSFAGLLADVAELFRDQAKQKKLSLELACGDEDLGRIKSDPTRLRQILVNLVGNALKFTIAGGIRIDAGRSVDGRELVVRVRDTGVGLSPDQTTTLFRPFVQADVSTTRRFGGTGLGLALSRRLANALGGDIVIDAAHTGPGCTFKLTFLDFNAASGELPVEKDSVRDPLPLDLQRLGAGPGI